VGIVGHRLNMIIAVRPCKKFKGELNLILCLRWKYDG